MCTSALAPRTESTPPVVPSPTQSITSCLLEQASNIHSIQILYASISVFSSIATDLEARWQDQEQKMASVLGIDLYPGVLQFRQPRAVACYEMLTLFAQGLHLMSNCEFFRKAYPTIGVKFVEDEDDEKSSTLVINSLPGWRKTELFRLRHARQLFELLDIQRDPSKEVKTHRDLGTVEAFTQRLLKVMVELQLDFHTSLVGRGYDITGTTPRWSTQRQKLRLKKTPPPPNKPDLRNPPPLLVDQASSDSSGEKPFSHSEIQHESQPIGPIRSERTPSTTGSVQQSCDSGPSDVAAPSDPITELLEMISAPRTPDVPKQDRFASRNDFWLETLPGLWLVAYDSFHMDVDHASKSNGIQVSHVLMCGHKVSPGRFRKPDPNQCFLQLPEKARPREGVRYFLRAAIFITKALIAGGNVVIPLRLNSPESSVGCAVFVSYLMVNLALPLKRAVGLMERYLSCWQRLGSSVPRPGPSLLTHLHALSHVLSRRSESDPTALMREEEEDESIATEQSEEVVSQPKSDR